MDPEAVLKFFDSRWFEQGIFTKEGFSTKSEPNPDQKSHPVEKLPSEPEVSRLPTHYRSKSEQLSSKLSSHHSSSSSNSGALQTILSGKEAFFTDPNREEKAEKVSAGVKGMTETGEARRRRDRGARRQTKRFCKSLSDLEFEELKGFMDLGFVFSEEDKDSRLVSVIPGLQRLGKKKKEEEDSTEEDEQSICADDESAVSRPYLSEAWEVLYRREYENPLRKWRITASNNELDVKDNLRWWAHAVASSVR